MTAFGLARYSALRIEATGLVEIWDSVAGETCHITFEGPNAFEIACGCARAWNDLVQGVIDGEVEILVPDALPAEWTP